MYGELASGKRVVGRRQLRFKNVCKREMRTLGIDCLHWEDMGEEEIHRYKAQEKRRRRRERISIQRQPTDVTTAIGSAIPALAS